MLYAFILFPYRRSIYSSSCPPTLPDSGIRMILTTKLVHPVKCLVR